MASVPLPSDPCTKPRRQGRHRFVGNICRECGARVEGAGDPSRIIAYDVAVQRFRDGCDAFETVLTSGDLHARGRAIVEWRNRLAELRMAEKELAG
jgi:hypothetical protein